MKTFLDAHVGNNNYYVKNNKLYVILNNGRTAKFKLVIDNNFKISLHTEGKYLDGEKEVCWASPSTK